MKKTKKRKATSASFFKDPEIKKFMADPKHKSDIEAKRKYLNLHEKEQQAVDFFTYANYAANEKNTAINLNGFAKKLKLKIRKNKTT